eukprot:jgi/Bigna1/145403/aug1.98_g20111
MNMVIIMYPFYGFYYCGGRSFFTENFQGQSIRRVTCNKCLRTSIDFPAFQFLPLSPPPNQETVRFVDLFSKLPRRHSLKKWSGDDEWWMIILRCPVCNLLKKENKNNKRDDDKNCYNHYTAKKPTTATTILPSSSSSSSSSSSTTTTVTFAGTPSTLKGSTILHNKHEILVEEGIWKLPNILMALIQRVMKTKSGKLIKNKTEIILYYKQQVWIPRRGLDLCTLAETEGVPMTHQHHHQQQKEDEKYDNDDKKKKKITVATSTNGQDSSTFNDKNVNSNTELEIEKYDEREHQQRQQKFCEIQKIMEQNIIKSRDVYVLFFQRQVFARAMNRLKIPGEPLTFKEWREKLKADTPLGGGAQSGFFTSNHAIRKRPMEHEKKSF